MATENYRPSRLYLDTLDAAEYQVRLEELWAFYRRIGIDIDGNVDLWKWKEQYEALERQVDAR